MTDTPAQDNCELCGTTSASTHRWYKYDNGEQFRAYVCRLCAARHDLYAEAK